MKIDLNKWVTQSEYARLHKIPLGTVAQWVKRARDRKINKPKRKIQPKVEILDVPQLGMTLIRR